MKFERKGIEMETFLATENASKALGQGAPSSSKSIFPFFTEQTQPFTAPFPFPILTSVGLEIIGKSGGGNDHQFLTQSSEAHVKSCLTV